MDTPTMSRCVAFLDALNSLPADDWRRRAGGEVARSNPARERIRAELERRCDAVELWQLRDAVETLCWPLPAPDNRRVREVVSDAVLALLAGVAPDEDAGRTLLATFADLVPEGERAPR